MRRWSLVGIGVLGVACGGGEREDGPPTTIGPILEAQQVRRRTPPQVEESVVRHAAEVAAREAELAMRAETERLLAEARAKEAALEQLAALDPGRGQTLEDLAVARRVREDLERDQRTWEPPWPSPGSPAPGLACSLDGDCVALSTRGCGFDPIAVNGAYAEALAPAMARLLGDLGCGEAMPLPEVGCRQGYCAIGPEPIAGLPERVLEGGRYAFVDPELRALGVRWGGTERPAMDLDAAMRERRNQLDVLVAQLRAEAERDPTPENLRAVRDMEAILSQLPPRP